MADQYLYGNWGYGQSSNPSLNFTLLVDATGKVRGTSFVKSSGKTSQSRINKQIIQGIITNYNFPPTKCIGKTFVVFRLVSNYVFKTPVAPGTSFVAFTAVPNGIPATNKFILTSHIGSLDFTVNQDGEVTLRQSPFQGTACKIRKLEGMGMIYYGQNGVLAMMPSGVAWGVKLLHSVGLLSKNSMVSNSTNTVHWFIDAAHILWKLSKEGLQKLDYSAKLAKLLPSTVMNYDPSLQIVHISDGVRGFILSEEGLGGGYATLTGMGYQNGVLYVIAPTPITAYPPIDFQTEFTDFGIRGIKNIQKLEIGCSSNNPIFAICDYKQDRTFSHTTTPAESFDNNGQILNVLNISGREFRYRIFMNVYEKVNIAYVKVYGKGPDNQFVRAIA